jgi:hypothetical protein
MTVEEKAQALAELQAVMKKWDMTFYWDCGEGSDTHGLYDEEVGILIVGEEVIYSTEGSSFDSSDLS